MTLNLLNFTSLFQNFQSFDTYCNTLSLVFLVSGASYRALYETSFALVLFLLRAKSNKTDVNKVSYKTLYKAQLTRKTRFKSVSVML